MIKVDQKEVLRRQVLIEGKSIRQTARDNHCSRGTVKNALLDASPSVYHLSQPRPCPVMDSFREVIDQWLLADRQQPAKQRHTAHRIYERLRAAPYHCQIVEFRGQSYRFRQSLARAADPAAVPVAQEEEPQSTTDHRPG